MKSISLFLTVTLLSFFLFNCLSVCALQDSPAGDDPFTVELVNDHFDDDHTYYDGDDIDVDGTQWDGVMGTEFLVSMEANDPSNSYLELKLLDTEITTGSPLEYPYLYKNITGDFAAEMKFINPIAETYILNFITCVDFANSNQYLVGGFPMAPVWNFWDYNSAHEYGAQVLDAGIGPFVGTNLYYRMTREGNTFNAYSRPHPESNWHNFATFTPSFDFPFSSLKPFMSLFANSPPIL